MNIPQIDQDTATIKAIYTQYENGYHISNSDYKQFLDVFIRLNELKNAVRKEIK